MDCEISIRQSSFVNRQSQALSVLSDAVQVRELVSVLRALEDEGAIPLVFKGAALAHTHYAESWRRPHADADVLIAPESRERVSYTHLRAHETGRNLVLRLLLV